MEQQHSNIQKTPIVCISLDGTEGIQFNEIFTIKPLCAKPNIQKTPIVCVSLDGTEGIQLDDESIKFLCDKLNILPTQLYIEKVALKDITSLKFSIKILCLIGIDSLLGIDCSEILCLTICKPSKMDEYLTFTKKCCESLVYLEFRDADFKGVQPGDCLYKFTSLETLNFIRCRLYNYIPYSLLHLHKCKDLKVKLTSNIYGKNSTLEIPRCAPNLTISHDTEGILSMMMDLDTKVDLLTENQCTTSVSRLLQYVQIEPLPLSK